MMGRGRGLDVTAPDIRTEREMLPGAAPDAGRACQIASINFLIAAFSVQLHDCLCGSRPALMKRRSGKPVSG